MILVDRCMAILAFCYDVSHVLFCLLILSGDVELHPGPRFTGRPQCRVMYSNIRGLYKNIHDLIAEILIPGFKMPRLLRSDAIPRARGMALYIRNDFSATNQRTY